MALRFKRFSETVDVDSGQDDRNSIENSSSDVKCRPQESQHPIISFYSKGKIIVAVVVALVIIFGFVTLVSFIVKCDEDKLINHFEERRTSFERAISDWADSRQSEKLDSEENYKSQKIRWVPGTQFDEYVMEPAGNELYGKGTLLLYVARAPNLDGTVVGKYVPHLRKMFIGYDRQEPKKSEFELLTFPRGTLSWIYKNSSTLLDEADLVYGGAAPISGESTFICRGKSQGHLIVGKLLKKIGKCLVAYMKTEFGLDNFEVLTVNEMGRAIGVDS